MVLEITLKEQLIMLKQLSRIAIFLLGCAAPVLAKSFVIYCPLNIKTDDHLYRDFVKNCGARVEDIDPEIFQIIFASLQHIETADAALMTKTVQDWLASHKGEFKGIPLDLSDARFEANKIYVTTDFIENKLYRLRDDLQELIQGTKFPSGKTYQLDTNTKGFHLFSIMVADTDGLKARRIQRATRTLSDRLNQAKIIYDKTYTQVSLEEPAFKILEK